MDCTLGFFLVSVVAIPVILFSLVAVYRIGLDGYAQYRWDTKDIPPKQRYQTYDQKVIAQVIETE